MTQPGGRRRAGQRGRRRWGLAIALVTAVTVAAVVVRFGLSPVLPAFCYLAAAGVPLAFAGARQRRLPGSVTLPSYPASLLLPGVAAPSAAGGPGRFLPGLIGMATAVAVYLVLLLISAAVRGRQPGGHGGRRPPPVDSAARTAGTTARQWWGSYTARSKAENRRRRELLARLADALNPPSAAAYPIRARLRLTSRLRPYLNVHAGGWPRLRVYCAGRAGRYALLTGNGQVIRLDEGIAAAAAAVQAACTRRESGQPAAGPAAAAVQPGP